VISSGVMKQKKQERDEIKEGETKKQKKQARDDEKNKNQSSNHTKKR
jgi:hypothetical protein